MSLPCGPYFLGLAQRRYQHTSNEFSTGNIHLCWLIQATTISPVGLDFPETHLRSIPLGGLYFVIRFKASPAYRSLYLLQDIHFQ